MSPTVFDDLRIGPAPPARQPQALWLLHSDEEETPRRNRVRAALDGAARGAISLRELLEARRGNRLVGTAWGQLIPGKTATVWPARLVQGEPEPTADALQRELDERLRACGTCVAQAVLKTPGGQEAIRLLRHGYHHAADLLYLVAVREQFPASPPACALQYELYEEGQRQRLGELIEATYVRTMDVPALNGVRRIDDVLTGYQHTGVFEPRRWLFARAEGQDVGCLLLADHPHQDQWELVYMGLKPAARGRGWGLEMTRLAQWSAGNASRGKLVLAVDAANEPAVAVYARAGFTEWDRRSVFLRIYDTPPF